MSLPLATFGTVCISIAEEAQAKWERPISREPCPAGPPGAVSSGTSGLGMWAGVAEAKFGGFRGSELWISRVLGRGINASLA